MGFISANSVIVWFHTLSSTKQRKYMSYAHLVFMALILPVVCVCVFVCCEAKTNATYFQN